MPPRPQLPNPFGPFRILRPLGEGGMGTVYLAEDTRLGHQLALKVPHLGEEDGKVLERFLREARLAQSLHHPFVCPVYEVDQIEGIHYLTMPFIEGQPLSKMISPEQPWPQHRAVELIRRLALALEALHQKQVIHRDLKPHNIMVKPTGEPMLMDFGLARPLGEQEKRLTSTGRAVGTPAYMPPEQVNGDHKAIGPATDVYSLGMILYELLTGQLPFEADNLMALFNQIFFHAPTKLSTLRPGLSVALEPICLKSLAKQPRERHPSMAELAQELANWLQQHPEPSAPTPIHASPSPGTPEATRLACPGCGVRLRLPEGSWGKRFRCPNCQVRFQVPDLATLSHQPNRGQGQSLIVTPERARGQRYTVSLSDTVTMEFTWIEPGTFLMGSPPEEEKRRNNEFQHRVHLTRGYWLGIHQVTQAQWQAIMGDNPSHFQGADLPVECVSWDDCKAFCEKLKQRTGKDFRLPTEAEWEYACRAGTTTPFYFGETISTDQANYDGNCVYGRGQKGIYREKTTPVGNFPPNAWGLYDMHGNVWEWCEDWYDADYYKEDSKENKRPNYGRSRVLRGGSWFNLPVDCRAAYRNSGEPGFRYYGSGVRVCFRVD